MTDLVWKGRSASEGWRILREKPTLSPDFVAPRPIDAAQLSHLHLLYSHISNPEHTFEWDSIRENSAAVVKGPPNYMLRPDYHWLSETSLKV